MPENEKPKLAAELLHQILGEYVEKAGQTLRRHEQVQLRFVVSVVVLTSVPLVFGAIANFWLPQPSSSPDADFAATLGLLLAVGGFLFLMAITSKGHTDVAKQDLALSAWQLRRIYEIASRYEDTGPQIEPALRTGIVLKLGEAQLLLTQLEKFEAKDGRFEHMRSLGADPLKLQPREEVRPSATTGLATTER